mgnify:CR=1 FL=1
MEAPVLPTRVLQVIHPEVAQVAAAAEAVQGLPVQAQGAGRGTIKMEVLSWKLEVIKPEV